MSQKNEQTLQQLTAQFEELVAWFEQDDFDVEQALEKYEKAHSIAAEIKKRLDTVENKISVLQKSFDE